MNARPPRSGSWNACRPGSPIGASPSTRSSPTTAAVTSPETSRPPAHNWASRIAAPDPAGPAPTAKPNASSKPCCANGPTPPSIAPATNAPWHSRPGSTTTTTDDPTAPSVTDHQPPGYPPPDQRAWDLQLVGDGSLRVSRDTWHSGPAPPVAGGMSGTGRDHDGREADVPGAAERDRARGDPSARVSDRVGRGDARPGRARGAPHRGRPGGR